MNENIPNARCFCCVQMSNDNICSIFQLSQRYWWITGPSMPARRGLLAPQNTFLDTIATRFDGTRKYKLAVDQNNNYQPMRCERVFFSLTYAIRVFQYIVRV